MKWTGTTRERSPLTPTTSRSCAPIPSTWRHRPATEALPIAERARRLDPVSPNARMNLGIVLRLARRNDEAARKFEETLDLEPNFALAQALLGMTYLSKGCPTARSHQRSRHAISALRDPTSSRCRDTLWRRPDTETKR